MNMRPFALSLLMACAAGAGLGVAAADAQSSSVRDACGVLLDGTKQAKPLDPQAFVKDAAAPAATGPQGIKHAAGFRPAFIGTDASSDPVYNADGKSLGFTLGTWLGPRGSVMMERSGPGMTVTVSLSHLLPNAQYSLFENHFDQNPVGFTALDGTGTSNSFRTDASGNAKVTVKSPKPLTHDNAVLVIYDNDGQTHGTMRGAIGVDAQHQMIARPPG